MAPTKPISKGTLVALVLAAAAAFPLSGCTLTTDPPVAYAEVDAAPPSIETQPSTVYEGQTVYLYNDRWYYRHGEHWAYYRSEPTYLRNQRAVVRRAPPAEEHRDRGYVAAPPARREAPPAYRLVIPNKDRAP